MKKGLVLLFLVISIAVHSQSQRNYLKTALSEKGLDIKNDWISFPNYTNRPAWNDVDSARKKSFIEKAVKRLKYQYQFVPSSAYLAFATTGDRGIMERPYGQNCSAVSDLVLGELLEAKGRFIPQIIKGIDNLTEMQTWALSAHLSLQGNHKEGVIDSTQNIIDLGAGRTGAMLAWTNYFLHDALDKVRPGTSAKLTSEIERRIVDPYDKRTDFWWMALNGHKLVNNWNVWCNYNSLTCILLVEKDKKRREKLVTKTLQSVDKFLNYYKDDGACEEGPSYWGEAGGNLYNYLSLIDASTHHRINIFDKQLVKNIAAYIYKVYIGNQYYVNFADAHAKIVPDAGLIYGFGKAVNDPAMSAFGSYLTKTESLRSGDIFETLSFLFDEKDIKNTPAPQPLLENVEYPETQIAIGRDKGNSLDGFYFAAKGGNNAESHNHNDIGSFILYHDGMPVLIDIGSGTYTAKTFSSKRYELFNTRSLNHNVPLINGVEQKAGAKYKATSFDYKQDKASVQLQVEIAAAYPDSAHVNKWERTFQLERNKSFTIQDEFDLKENNGKCSENFVTAILPKKVKDGLLNINTDTKPVYLEYDSKLLNYECVPIPLTDPVLISQWGTTLYRLEFVLDKNSIKGKNTITIKE